MADLPKNVLYNGDSLDVLQLDGYPPGTTFDIGGEKVDVPEPRDEQQARTPLPVG